ncbi:MAG: MmgE/PrpD family protein [Hyphomicrobiaceae bacterium]|nr:MmgE/PrpD family protein [Hyphomicrobiaceae bacterium]
MRISDLAQWVASVGDVAPQVKQAGVKVVADAVASAISGHRLTGSVAARRAALSIWGDGEAPIWFTPERGSLTAAAFANSMSTCILDFDDGHRLASGHPGAAIVPAAIASAQILGASTERLLTAIAVGYEVGIRIAASRDVRALDTLVTGRWCGQGVAAAIGWLKGDGADQLAEAMAIAGAIAPYMFVAEYTQVGNHTKEAIPWGTANGILAGQLAAEGLKGPLDILDHSSFNAEVLANGNDGAWFIESTYFKPYSCCRWIHAPIDAILLLRDQVIWQEVSEVEVATIGRTLSLNNQIRPTTVQAAQYSVPFCVAAAAIHGAKCLQPMSERLLKDERIFALASKVRLVVDPKLDEMYPGRAGGRVSIISKANKLEKEVLVPKGDATNPMSWDEQMDKLTEISLPELGDNHTSQVKEALFCLRDGLEIEPLLKCLSKARVD